MKSNFEQVCSMIEDEQQFKVFRCKDNGEYLRLGETGVDKVDGDMSKLLDMLYFGRKKKESERKAKRITYTLCISFLIGMLGLSGYKFYKTYEDQIKYFFDEDKEMDKLLLASLDENTTISDENKTILKEYLNIICGYNISDSKVVEMSCRLKNINFTNVDLSNKEVLISILNRIFSINDNSFVSNQLYNYINNKYDYSSNDSKIAALFSFDEDIVTKLFNGESLNSLLKEYEIKINNINDIDEMNKISIDLANRSILKDKVVNEEIIMFGELENNIFDDCFAIKVHDYIEYFYSINDDGIVNVSNDVYKYKLNELIRLNGGRVDYTNKDYRFIVYLYASGVLNNEISIDIVDSLFNSCFNPNATLDEVDLKIYLSSGRLSQLTLFKLSELANDEATLGLLQEVNLCLKEEVRCGNMDVEAYNYFANVVYLKLMDLDSRTVVKYLEANMLGESMDDSEVILKLTDL